jgi:hypothetical protein
MVVNNYAGMPFNLLERGFAGLMLRDDMGGQHFDPRAVELKFALQGTNGIFLPLVFDLEAGLLHWLDVYSRGELQLNNVATSNRTITKICPEMIGYFASGVRTSMLDLALLNAAARSRRVYVRGAETRLFVRAEGEEAERFLGRLRSGVADGRGVEIRPGGGPVLAALYRGDVDVPEGSACYALFREGVVPTLAASDLI